MSTTTEPGSVRTFRLAELPKEVLERGRGMAGAGRDIWLAGLGAVATVEEEGASLFETLVKRGETMEKTGRQRLDGVRTRLTTRQKQVVESLEEAAEPVASTFQRLGLPSRTEVRDLSTRVDRLSRKVDALLHLMTRDRPAPAAPQAVFAVTMGETGWQVARDGTELPLSIHPTKEQALEAARAAAAEAVPSLVHVHRKDGTLQDTLTFDE